MRGKVTSVIDKEIYPRITPAYAGKSYLRLLHILRRRDHPRLCGEKTHGDDNQKQPQGSPPPMRGKDNW